MRAPTTVLGLAAAIALRAVAPAAAEETLLLIVRHAEKQDVAGNPDLTARGLERAEALAEFAAEYPVGGVYSTDLCRTAQTAQPTAARFGMPIAVQISGSSAAGLDACDPPITSSAILLDPAVSSEADLLSWILDQHAGQTVVIVGHSNTVPRMLGRLGLGPIEMTDDEYDRLFMVTYDSESGARMVETRYGPETEAMDETGDRPSPP
jgi:phosphohistidine phosphatase SixA